MATPSGGIQPTVPTDGSLYNVRIAKREVTVHMVTNSELDTVASLSNSVHLAFLGMCGGAFLTLGITILTVDIHDPKTYAAFVGSTIVTFVGSIYFGVRSRLSYKDAERKLKEIKQPMVSS